MNDGVITGFDVRACFYGGSVYFHFINISDSSNKQVVNPGIFIFPANLAYPIYVKVVWQKTNSCAGPAIRILRYQLPK